MPASDGAAVALRRFDEIGVETSGRVAHEGAVPIRYRHAPSRDFHEARGCQGREFFEGGIEVGVGQAEFPDQGFRIETQKAHELFDGEPAHTVFRTDRNTSASRQFAFSDDLVVEPDMRLVLDISLGQAAYRRGPETQHGGIGVVGVALEIPAQRAVFQSLGQGIRRLCEMIEPNPAVTGGL